MEDGRRIHEGRGHSHKTRSVQSTRSFESVRGRPERQADDRGGEEVRLEPAQLTSVALPAADGLYRGDRASDRSRIRLA